LTSYKFIFKGLYLHKFFITKTVIITLLLLSSAKAFDNHRKGFLFSIGAGMSRINMEVTPKFQGYSADDNSFGFDTSFKIGYGFTDQFLLYYINDVTWYKSDLDYDDDTYVSGITGIGITYYPKENEPWYIMGGIGVGSYINISKDESDTGSAYIFGAGYEISSHFQVEATYRSTKLDTDYQELTTGAFRLTANYMWY